MWHIRDFFRSDLGLWANYVLKSDLKKSRMCHIWSQSDQLSAQIVNPYCWHLIGSLTCVHSWFRFYLTRRRPQCSPERALRHLSRDLPAVPAAGARAAHVTHMSRGLINIPYIHWVYWLYIHRLYIRGFIYVVLYTWLYIHLFYIIHWLYYSDYIYIGYIGIYTVVI